MRSKFLILAALTTSVSACATLPSSGPTGAQVIKQTERSNGALNLVEVKSEAELPPKQPVTVMTLRDRPPPPTDMIGPGDVLEITIYEAGVSLFGSTGPAGAVSAPGFDTSAKAHTLPPTRVNDDGDIRVPFVGRVRVLGKTIAEVQEEIRRSLKGMTQDPQVLISPRDFVTNSIIVSGEVARPGRLVLQTNRETLSDVVALAGGYRGRANDLALRITRGQERADLRLSDLTDDPNLDVRAYPGDRVAVLSDPRSFSVLGASGRVDQIAFTHGRMSLAEAIAASGGTNSSLGDPAAIFVFRYTEDGQGRKNAVVYHINMMQAGSYFLAQRFAILDHDVIYFGNARANQPSKMIQLISQLFSPILTVTSAVQTVQNSTR
jgi:polysaccharide export outer membrane protein